MSANCANAAYCRSNLASLNSNFTECTDRRHTAAVHSTTTVGKTIDVRSENVQLRRRCSFDVAVVASTALVDQTTLALVGNVEYLPFSVVRRRVL